MPVTARLSEKCDDAWGKQQAQDPVDWFDQVEATYRADFRELNELNFARLDAKFEQRIGALDAKLQQQIAALDARLEQWIAEARAELEAEIADVTTAQTAERAGLLKWMFIFWAGTVVPV